MKSTRLTLILLLVLLAACVGSVGATYTDAFIHISDNQNSVEYVPVAANATYDAIEALKLKENVTLILHSGDMVNDPYNNTQWDTNDLAESHTTIPIKHVAGNHCYGDNGNGTMYKTAYDTLYPSEINWTYDYGPFIVIGVSWLPKQPAEPMDTATLNMARTALNNDSAKIPIFLVHYYWDGPTGLQPSVTEQRNISAQIDANLILRRSLILYGHLDGDTENTQYINGSYVTNSMLDYQTSGTPVGAWGAFKLYRVVHNDDGSVVSITSTTYQVYPESRIAPINPAAAPRTTNGTSLVYSTWNPNYNERIKINLNNPSGSTIPAFQANISVQNTTGSNTKSTLYLPSIRGDFNDTQMTDSGSVNLSFVPVMPLDTFNIGTQQFWFKTVNISTGLNSFYMYYRNSAKDKSSGVGTNTFPLYDHFDDATIDTTTRWISSVPSAVSLSNSQMTLTNTTGSATPFTSIGASFTANTSLVARIKSGHNDTSQNEALRYYDPSGTTSGRVAKFAYSANSRSFQNVNGGTSTYSAQFAWTPNSYKTVEMMSNGTTSNKYFLDGSLFEEISTNVWTQPNRIIYVLFGTPGGANITTDYIFVRNTTFPEPYIESVEPSETVTITPDFIGYPVVGDAPLNVSFYDMTMGDAITTGRNWSFGDGNYSVSKNPYHNYISNGSYSVSLTVTTDTQTVMTAKSGYVFVGNGGDITATFTPSGPLFTSVGQPVTFTDTSTGSPTAWDWMYQTNGDGSLISFNTTQNATFFPPATGNYTIALNASNSFSYNQSTQTTWVNVSPQSGYNQQDLTMTPQFMLTVHIVDSSTNLPIPVVLVTDSLGNNQTTSVGTFTGTYGPGTVVLYLASSGYDSKSASYIMDSDRVETVQMVKSITVPDSGKLNLLYPHEVQFTLVDSGGRSLSNVNVTALMTSSSVENTNWYSTLFGISTQATSVNETTLYAVSDDGGSFTMPMISSGRYTMTFTSVTKGISESRIVSPQQAYYIFILNPTASLIPNKGDYINGTLYQTEPNSSYVDLKVDYIDIGHTTTSIMFFVNDGTTGIRLYTKIVSGYIGNSSHSVANTASASYVWGYYADSTVFGNVSEAQGIMMKGATGKMFNLDPCGGYATGWGNEC